MLGFEDLVECRKGLLRMEVRGLNGMVIMVVVVELWMVRDYMIVEVDGMYISILGLLRVLASVMI